jgi:hypothetical protein
MTTHPIADKLEAAALNLSEWREESTWFCPWNDPKIIPYDPYNALSRAGFFDVDDETLKRDCSEEGIAMAALFLAEYYRTGE